MSFNDIFRMIFGGNYFHNRFPFGTEDSEHKRSTDSPMNNGENNLRDPLFDFEVMTNPFEMDVFHKRILEMFENFFDVPNLPTVEESIHPRDLYLKPEFNQSNLGDSNLQEDNSSKEKGNSNWFNTISPWINEQQKPLQQRSFSSYSERITFKDGILRKEKIVRNSDGTEERTVSESLPNENNKTQLDIIGPTFGFSGLEKFDMPEAVLPKNHFLKPGYESINPNAEKIDSDLDKEITFSGIKNLPRFSMSPETPEAKPDKIEGVFTSEKTTIRNGIVETEKIVRNADGTEQKTVTRALAEQQPSVFSGSEADSNMSKSGRKFKNIIDFLLK